MSSYLSAAVPIVNSKASVIPYVIGLCTSYNEKNNTRSVDVVKAQKIFDFITKNVNLPDVAKEPCSDVMEKLEPTLEGLLKTLESKLQSMET